MPKRDSVAGTAADPTIAFAPLEIDGEIYQLCYDFNAIAEAEKLAEANLLHGIAALLFNSMTAAQARGLLYAALRKAQPKMSFAEAGALVRIDTLPDIREALLKAYNDSLPEKKRFIVPAEAESSPPAS